MIMSEKQASVEQEREEKFWDKVGSKWLEGSDATALQVGNAARCLSGSSVAFDYLMRQLGDPTGLRVLDYGCGSGWLSTYLARRGAIVDGFDISSQLVDLGMKRATVNGVSDRVHLRKMTAEHLDYSDGAFDRVVGISILHHVSLDESARELFRVVKPGGKALFIEPLGESRMLNAIRNYVFRVHHGEVRAVDAEHPLTYNDVNLIGASFDRIELQEFQLTEMIARVTGDKITRALGLQALDAALLRVFPSLKRFCRLVVVTYIK
jgi:2-polyprenyl-3-methyl-5-hydroxy-6-metoxy-1,4-benzoquinol methylase